MGRIKLITFVILLVACSVVHAQEKVTLKELEDKLDHVSSEEERYGIVLNILENYPEGPHTQFALNYAVSYKIWNLKDIQGAREFRDHIYDSLKTPRVVAEVEDALLKLYTTSGVEAEFDLLVDKLNSNPHIPFGTHSSILKFAGSLLKWELILRQCDLAQPLATAEAFKAEWPDVKYSSEQYEEAARNRQAILDSYRAIALHSLGDREKAYELFEDSERNAKMNFFGIPDFDLYRFWTRAAIADKDYERAWSKASRLALWNHDEEAMKLLESLFVEINGSMQGFEDALLTARKETGPFVEDFALSDYSGATRNFDDLKGKVTLLTFWFPT